VINVLNCKVHTEIVSLPGLYLDGTVLVNLPRLTQLAHVTVRDVLAIDLHAIDMLPHSVAHSTSPLGKHVRQTDTRLMVSSPDQPE